MNAINPDLQFTVETGEDYQDGWLPTLDFKIKVIDGQIVHTYFEKPMKSQLVLMERTAMGEQQKYQILSNELIRRLSKISPKIWKKEKIDIVDQFTRQLKNSGYGRKEARQAIISGIVGYERKCAKRRKDGMNFYRNAASTLKRRVKKKLLQKTTWYKQKKRNENENETKGKRTSEENKKEKEKGKEIHGGSKVKAVMFVPQTKGSRLAKMLREKEYEMEKLSGFRMKIVERAGEKLEDILCQSNPWAGIDCERQVPTMQDKE